MIEDRLSVVAGAAVGAALVTIAPDPLVPLVVRLPLAGLLLLMLPGLSVIEAVLPSSALTAGERVLASLGMSMAIAVCSVVVLGATPIGLSRTSLAVTLGGIGAATYAVTWLRPRCRHVSERLLTRQRTLRDVGDEGDQ